MNGSAVAKNPSSSVGDYLKAIWDLAGEGTASTKDVAERLSISSASVSNMFVRLREMGLTEYERYQGASLTEAGRVEALRLLRRHRLLEIFLSECLGYSWEEVHEEAERLEHSVSDEFTERLAEFLGHPANDPHGDPIPAADGSLEPDDSFPLSAATPGQRVRIYRVGDEEAEKLGYLEQHGLIPGRLLEVKEARALDGVVTVEDEDGEARSLGGPLAGSVFVRDASESG
ncbi:MAG: metal-dependent transcriptional regulator [Actinomycetota bacterium]|jgi:DtxR family Mn-dependent transcriptional regulator|nr:metal-dependent transcriptional regulator [Actinomycetota bacterium]